MTRPFVLFALLAVAPALAQQSVMSTKHNLSISGPGPVKAQSETQVCIFCHVPHRGGPQGNNRPLSAATYQPYASTTQVAPSPGVRVRGPFSTLQSFAKIDYQRVCNGGPITMELSDTVFRTPESIRKTAMLVRAFAQLGCMQLQLNSLSLDTLLDAKSHPENHRNLIVRVWGWSGYFCELAPEYQDQIIARHLYEFQ